VHRIRETGHGDVPLSVGGNLGFAIGGPAAIFLVTGYGLPAASALLVRRPRRRSSSFPPCRPSGTGSCRRPPPAEERAGRRGPPAVRRLPHHPDRGAALLDQLGLATYIPFLYQAQLKSDPAYVATLLFLFLGSGTVGTVIGGPLADRFGHRRFLFGSFVLQIPLVFLFLRATGWPVFALAALLGGRSSPPSPSPS